MYKAICLEFPTTNLYHLLCKGDKNIDVNLISSELMYCVFNYVIYFYFSCKSPLPLILLIHL